MNYPISASAKHVLLLAVFLFVGFAQVFGQAVSTYTPLITSGTYTSVGTNGTEILGNVDDASSSAVNIGFTFNLGGQNFTQFVANSNGHIRLGGTAPTVNNTPISTTTNTYSISAAGRDGKSTGAVRYFLSGTAPNRVGIIQYTNYDLVYNATTRRVSFQIRLYEGTNVIEIIYTGATGTTTTAAIEVGLRGSTTDGDVRNYSGSSNGWGTLTAGTTRTSTIPWGSSQNTTRSMPSNGRILRWTPPVVNYRHLYNSISSGSSSWCPGETRTVTINLTNNGVQPWTSGWTPPNSVNFSWWGSWQSGQDANPRVLPFSNLTQNSSQNVSFDVTAPTTPGSYTINSDLVRDGVCWFRGNGAPDCGPGNSLFTSPTFTVVGTPGNAASPVPANTASGVCYLGNGAVTALSWAAVSGATGYDVYFGNTNPPALVSTNQAGTSYNTGALSASTIYYWRIAPRNACGINNSGSVWSFTTASAPCYCASNATSGNDSRINNVTFNTINQTSPNSCQTYTNYTSVSTTVNRGTTYSLSFTLGTCDGNYNKIGAAYIDWNGNGIFTDAGELVTTSPSINGTATHTANITVPIGATLGATRLRVVCIEGSSTPPSCGTYSYGETEDYTVVICSPPAQPGAITGSRNHCTGNQSYSISSVSGATSYTWSATGGTITGGQGTTNATINWTSEGTQTVSVTANNSCPSAATTLSVEVFCGCPNDATDRPYGTMNPGCNSFNEDTLATAYYKSVDVVQGVNYTFSTCNGAVFNSTSFPSIQSSLKLTLKNTSNTTLAYSAGYGPECNTTRGELDWSGTFTGTIRAYVNNSGCGQAFTSGSSAVLKVRQNTTVANTTPSGNLCLDATRNLTYTLSGAHSSPNVAWSIVSGSAGGAINSGVYTPANPGTITIRASLGVCASDVTFDVITCGPPTITNINPDFACANAGDTVYITGTNFFGVTDVKIGTQSIFYQYQNNNLIIAAVPPGASSGAISVTTPLGTATSSQTFTIYPAPVISTQPVSATTCEEGTASFTANSSTVGATYLWQFLSGGVWYPADMLNSTGYNSGTLNITYALGAYNGGQVRCVVSASGCSTISDTVTLTVETKPAILQHPQDVSLCPDQGVQTLTVAATGVGLTYQWYKNGSPLTADAVYSGVSSSSLTITAPPVGENGAQLTVLVSGTCNAVPYSVMSAVATLTVVNAAPAPSPVYASNYVVCDGQTINLIGFAQGYDIDFYTQSIGGTPVYTAASGVATPDFVPTNGQTWYAETRMANTTCISTRSFIGTITVIPNDPNNPQLGYIPPVRVCEPGSITLNASPCVSGTVNWYDSPTACTPLHTGQSYTTSVSATTNFYTNVTGPVVSTSTYTSTLNNERFGYAGQMFEVEAAPGKTITIKSLTFESDGGTNIPLRVYYKKQPLTLPSSFPAGANNGGVSDWTKVHEVNSISIGAGTNHTATFNLDSIVIPAGCKFSIYIYYRVRYHGDNDISIANPHIQSNNDLTIYGLGLGAASGTTEFNMAATDYRAFRGSLGYNVKLVSPMLRVPVVVDGNVNIPNILGDNSVCKGQTIDLDIDVSQLPTGGTITSVNGYRIHTFTGNGTFNVPAGMAPLNVEVLVVAGGGGGGNGRGGGGGAGGLVYNPSIAISGSNSVVVGNGGAANTNGQNSTFASITAIGGGRGGSHINNDAGGSGGSGGGAAMNYGTNIWAGGSATSGQGFVGARSGFQGTDDPRNTGGGGGAGSPGKSGIGTTGRPNGGDGLPFDISGTVTYYAAGGGGSRGGTDRTGAGAGYGGNGGGGTGGGDLTQSAGAANTGSGGGGSEGTGSAGGSGVVIIRYSDPTAAAFSEWVSTNPGVAAVNDNSGVVTGIERGGADIKYVVTTPAGCIGEKTQNVVVKKLPTVPVVTDDSPVCENVPVNIESRGMAPGGKAVSLTGSNTISAANISSVSNTFTIEFWAKPSRTRLSTSEMNTSVIPSLVDNEQSLAIMADNRGADAGAGVSVGTNGVSVVEHGSGYFPSLLVHDMSISDWTHIAVVYNNRTPSLYVNGIFIKTGLQSSKTTVYPSASTGSSYGYYNGELDNIRIWNVAHTQSQIVENMNLETPYSSFGLISHYTFNDENGNALVGTNNTVNGGTYPLANYYTYTWSGAHVPSPASSQSETQVIYGAQSGTHGLSVTATFTGGCSSDGATESIIVNANNQPASSWNATSTDDATDWFDPKNWSNCTPGDQTVVTISRNKPSYPIITNTSNFDINPKGKAKAQKVTLDTSGSGAAPTLNINTNSELRVNE